MSIPDRLKHAALVLAFIAGCAFLSARDAHAQTTPTFNLTFALETSSADGKTVTPRLTWTTTPAASTCTASGSANWTGPQQPSGTVLLPAVSTSHTYGITCTLNGVTKFALTWVAPTENTDNTPIAAPGPVLKGFKIKYGQAANALTTTANVADPAARSWTSPDLSSTTWFAAVIAYNTLDLESDLSAVVNKSLSASQNATRALELTIRFPKPPTGVQ